MTLRKFNADIHAALVSNWRTEYWMQYGVKPDRVTDEQIFDLFQESAGMDRQDERDAILEGMLEIQTQGA